MKTEIERLKFTNKVLFMIALTMSIMAFALSGILLLISLKS